MRVLGQIVDPESQDLVFLHFAKPHPHRLHRCCRVCGMLCLWLENCSLEVRRVDLPRRTSENEVIVKVIRAGICNTDLELTRGYYPYKGILGHEFVGIVTDGPDSFLNKRVVGEINITCLSKGITPPCALCASGNSSHCSTRSVVGIVNQPGAMAEYLSIPVHNIYLLPESISTDDATFIEPLAAALEILEQITISPNSRVLVVGDGKLGQLISQTLQLTGCCLFVLGRHEEKLSHLAGRGISTCTALSEDQIDSFDITVECTGNPSGFTDALRYVRPRGTIVLKSTYASTLNIDASRIVVNEVTLLGSRCGPFDKAIALLERGGVDVGYLIEAKYSLRDGLLAFTHAEKKGSLKILLEME
jgi:threonine dehydrogenase-like Zn-dependent dehydrogenase